MYFKWFETRISTHYDNLSTNCFESCIYWVNNQLTFPYGKAVLITNSQKLK